MGATRPLQPPLSSAVESDKQLNKFAETHPLPVFNDSPNGPSNHVASWLC